MKKLCLCIILACLFTEVAIAQRIMLKGVVADTTKSPIEFVTVALLTPTDSALVHFTSTAENGVFEFKKIEPKAYLLKITFVGYQTFHKNLDLKADTVLDTLQMVDITLQEVTLKGEKDPVRIAKDTIEFNASSFKTRTNATLEDLLKKLPNVQVDAKGNIKTQGQEVSKVFVNGKEFFGGTPQMATQNLPADAISKVQIVDQKSDQTQTSGIDDGQNIKIINIETKNQDKRMNFGKAMAGYGTDERYEAKGNFNTFNKKNQFSVIGMHNNINNTGFSYEDYQDFSNRGEQSRGGGGDVTFGGDGTYSSGFNFGFGGNNYGFLRNTSVGVNMNQTLHKKVELNASYFLTQADNTIEKTENSETFLNTNYFATNQINNQYALNLSHKGSFSINYKIDSMRNLRAQGGLDYADNDNTTYNLSNSLTNGNIKTNESQRDNFNNAKRLNYRANIFYSQKFKKTGRTLSINLATTQNQQAQVGKLQARNKFFSNDSTALLNQQNNQNNQTQTYTTRNTYTEPITKKLTLSLNQIYQLNLNDSKREVFDIENEERKTNTLLSNDFDNIFEYHNGGFSLNLNEKKYQFIVGLATQFSHLKGNTPNLPTIEKRFENVLPSASFNYKFTKQTSFRMNYNAQINAPNINQLQPVPNNTNPLNIILGNSNLRPAYIHRFSTNFNSRNPDKFSSFYSYCSANYTTNNIVNEQFVDEKLIRTSRPINTRSSYSMNGNFTYNMNFKKIKSNVDVGIYARYNQTVNVINALTNLIHNQAIEGNLDYNWEWDKFGSISIGGSLEYQQTRYEANTAQNQRFLNQNYELSIDIDALEFMAIQANLDYEINRGITNDFFQALPMLDVAISVPCLRNDRGEFKLRGVNLLNQNTGISQNINANSIQQEFINSIGRYIMLSFTYSFREVKKPVLPTKK